MLSTARNIALSLAIGPMAQAPKPTPLEEGPATLAALVVPQEGSPAQRAKEPKQAETQPERSTTAPVVAAPSTPSPWSGLAAIGGVLAGIIGYAHYFTFGLRKEERTTTAFRRFVTAPFRDVEHLPCNRNFLKVSALNHFAAVALGCAALGNSTQSMFSLLAPMTYLIGSLCCYSISTPRKLNFWLKTCERLGMAAIGCLVLSKIPAIESLSQTYLGLGGTMLGIIAALTARTAAIVPLVQDCRGRSSHNNPAPTFAPLFNQACWMIPSLAALVAVPSWNSIGAFLPIGYVVQNTTCTGICFAYFLRWRSARSTMMQSQRQ